MKETKKANFLRQPIRVDIIGVVKKNGEISQHAIAEELGMWDEHCRFHIDKLIKAGVLSVRYQRGDRHKGIDKMLKIADGAEKILKDLK